jgi:hypothetical protein
MNIQPLKEIIEERKEKAIENLSTSYAKNRLPLEEYERLVEYIQKIESERELIVVEKIVAEYDGNDTSAKPTYDNDDNEPDYYAGHFQSSVTNNNLTILSSRTLSGPVKSGSSIVSILGSCHIKIRKSDLSKKRTTLDIATILGDCVVSVEGGIRVSNRAIPILGGAWTDHKVDMQAEDREPELVISGAALLGNITVKLLKL